MNFSVVLKMLLVVSIALQSLTSIASATSENHQVDFKHLQTQHDHKDDLNSFNDKDADEHDIKDCHHCGHCSGSHLSWFLTTHLSASTSDKILSTNNPPYQFIHTKAFLAPILRPPIS